MATPVSAKPGWRFGVFEVDTRGGELRRSGVPLKLRDQSFQILVALLERPGGIVTREELRRLLWSSDTFVDFDHSLNTAMMKLRDALGDSTEAPIYIETVPKHGYRFIAPVSSATDHPAGKTNGDDSATARAAELPAGARPTSAHSPGASRSYLRIAVVLGCLFLAAAGSLAFLWIHHSRTASEIKEPTNFHIVPVTSAPGIVLNPSLSPDGRAVAYHWYGPERNRYEMYVQLIGSPLPSRITYEGGRMGNPAWSPDGLEIAFTRCDLKGGEGAVIVVPALGGPERRITDAACQYNYPSPLAWSTADAGRLVFIDRCAADGPLGLISFSLATGKRECLTDAGQPGFERWFAFSISPDGSHVAFNPAIRGSCDIYIMPVAGGTSRQVLHDEPSCTSLMWTPDSQAIIFTSARTTLESLWRVSVGGNGLRKEPLYPAIGSFSRDGRRFVYQEVTHTEPPSVWRADLADAGEKVLVNRKLIATQAMEEDAQPSPDGRRLAWMSGRTGPAEIWVGEANGDRPRQLTHMNSYAGSPRWSPDGKWIAFDFDRGSLQIFVIDAEGRNLRQVTSGSGVNVVPSWSSDGKWIYFASERTGRREVWKHSLESGKELQVTTHGGFNAFESFDGRTLYFSKFDEAGIWSMPSQGGEESIVVEGKPQTLYWGQWALTRAGIYYMNVEAEPRARIDFYDFATRRAHPVLALDKLPIWAAPSLSATADGTTIYYAQHDFQSVAKMMEFAP
jgi:Tol biopolymer transport system component/DNA-binding winged helix-turn-helix (wHTH) protein